MMKSKDFFIKKSVKRKKGRGHRNMIILTDPIARFYSGEGCYHCFFDIESIDQNDNVVTTAFEYVDEISLSKLLNMNDVPELIYNDLGVVVGYYRKIDNFEKVRRNDFESRLFN